MLVVKIYRPKKPPVTRAEVADFFNKASAGLQQEILNDPEVADFYADNEEAIMDELEYRVQDFIHMKVEADKLQGSWWDKLKYRLSTR